MHCFSFSGNPRRNTRIRCMASLIAWSALLILPAGVSGTAGEDFETAADLCSAAGGHRGAAVVGGGVVVRLGVSSGAEVAALRTGDSFIVQGLDTDREKIDRVRQELAAAGAPGTVTVREFDGRRLPYIDNMVNLIVVSDGFQVADEELTRVLVPGGRAEFVDLASKSRTRRLTKPQPGDTDEWTHYLHDAGNNAVSRDTRIDSIGRQQWVGGPSWSRHHDHIAGMTAMVSGGGRIYYVMDEGKNWSVLLPSKFFLVARDSYNGTVLWKKPLASWDEHLWPLKSGPAQLPRRLVVHGRRLYLPLGMAEPLSVIDADTGDVLATYAETKSAEEVLVADGKVFVLANPNPELYEGFDLGTGHNDSQKARIAKEYPWKRTAREAGRPGRGERQAALGKAGRRGPAQSDRRPRVASSIFDGTQIVALDKGTGESQVEVAVSRRQSECLPARKRRSWWPAATASSSPAPTGA